MRQKLINTALILGAVATAYIGGTAFGGTHPAAPPKPSVQSRVYGVAHTVSNPDTGYTIGYRADWTRITEDDPDWDCTQLGDRSCATGTGTRS